MIAKTLGKCLETLSELGAGRASLFVAYQPKTPESLRSVSDSQKNSILFRLCRRISSPPA